MSAKEMIKETLLEIDYLRELIKDAEMSKQDTSKYAERIDVLYDRIEHLEKEARHEM